MDEIELKPSRWLGLIVAAMALLGGLAIALAALPLAIKWALATAVCTAIGYALHRQQSVLPRLLIGRDGGLLFRTESSEGMAASVMHDSFVSNWLCVVRLQVDGKRRTLTLLPDSAGEDSLRRLRVSLRWGFRRHSGKSVRDAG
jgi:toxin CptA